MPFNIPTKQQCVNIVRGAFRAEMPGTDAAVWPSNIYVSAMVMAGATWEVMKRLLWVDKQRFAFSATGDQLDAHAKEWGMGRKPPTYAQGNVLVPVTYPYTVPAGSTFTRSDGLIYTSTQAVSLFQYSNTLTVSVPIVCNTIGKIGNLSAGAVLTTSLSGLTGPVAVDDSGLGGGNDVETDTSLKARILLRKRKPPMGGCVYDYQEWALTIPGVTRVFVTKSAYGPGTVGVMFLMDDTYPNGLPQLSDVANVQTYLDSVAPATAVPIVTAPVMMPVNVVVQGFSPATSAARLSAGAELFALFRNMVQPSTKGDLFTLHQSWIWQAVGNAAGEQYHTIVSPPGDLTALPGQMFCLNSLTFE